MAAHVRLKNEFTEDEKYHSLMRWLKIFNVLEKLNIPLERASKDSKTNNTGYWLIHTFKNNNLLIVNGRKGSTRQRSVTNPLFSTETFGIFHDFEVVELDSIFSDVHGLLVGQ